MINEQVAIEWTEDLILQDVPKSVRKSVSEMSLKNPVRNTQWKYLKFKDSSVFSPAANDFNRSVKACEGTHLTPTYTNAIEGTVQYNEYWSVQKRRCLEGYEPEINGIPCGIKITGEHYFYLNFTRIMKYNIDKNTGEEVKKLDFPDFCSMDYYWFLELEKNENPQKYGLTSKDKKGMICAKARRKGFSFKNAAGALWKYTFFKESYVIIASYLADHAQATMNMVLEMSNFLNENTEFRHARVIDRQDEIKSGYKEKNANGIEIIKGYKSSIKIMTFKNSAFKSAGKSATRMIFEEAGLFENLKMAYTISEPLFRDGDKMIGIPIIFGTGGDMSSATKDFSDMFYNPKQYGLAEYDNIYEKTDINGKCGWFVDEMWYRRSEAVIEDTLYDGMDDQGNANRWMAEWNLDLERSAKRGSDKKAYNALLTQKCKTPSEAFLITEGNIFQTAELYARLSKLKSDDTYKYLGQVGQLVDKEGRVWWEPDLQGVLRPIMEYPTNHKSDTEGAIIIYEHPVEISGSIPEDLYIIGHDPWGIDSDGGKSLGATYVLKTKKLALQGYGHDEIVAEYVGRPDPGGMEEYNYNLEKLALYYNAKINFENDRGEVRPFFTKRKRLDLLCPPPYVTIQRHMPTSNMAGRKFGYSMGNDKLKQIGEQYVYDWLSEKRGVDEKTGLDLTNIDYLTSKPLIEELISYNRKGNFDRVMALIGCIIRLEEIHNPYTKEEDKHPLGFLFENENLFKKRNQEDLLYTY